MYYHVCISFRLPIDYVAYNNIAYLNYLLVMLTSLVIQAWLHVLGTEQSKDTCLYVEKDDMFSLDLQASESKKYLFVASESKNTRFNFYLDVSKPEDGLRVLTPRVDGIDTTVSHRGDHFFIKRRSDQFFNSEVVACPVDNTSSTTVLLPHRER